MGEKVRGIVRAGSDRRQAGIKDFVGRVEAMTSESRESVERGLIYLDNNATTKIDRRVADAMYAASLERFANPSSQHAEGRRARKALEEARERIAVALDCRRSGMTADRIILTSGGTEANNLAIRGRASKESGGLIVSAIEHPSILAAAEGGQKPELEESAFCPSIHWALFQWSNCASGSIYMTTNQSRHLSRSCLPITRRESFNRNRDRAGLSRTKHCFHTDAVQFQAKCPCRFHRSTSMR